MQKMSTIVKKAIRKAFSSRYLVLTNITTGVVSLSLADVMQQILEHRRKSRCDNKIIVYNHDYRRSFSMLAGGIYFGTGGHFWYAFLDRRFSGNSWPMIRRKLACEMIFGPPYVSLCFLLVNILEEKSFVQTWQSLKDNINYIFCTEWLFYLPLQALNFYFLPAKFRYLFVAVITLLYDNFLSYIFHRIPISKKISQQSFRAET